VLLYPLRVENDQLLAADQTKHGGGFLRLFAQPDSDSDPVRFIHSGVGAVSDRL
jgi:hypothetical protein